MNLGLTIELLANLIQQLMFFGFLYLFFDKDDNKVKNILAFSISVLLMFILENYFTFHDMTLNHLDTVTIFVTMMIYSIVFLKGELYLRILMPILALGLNILIAYLNILVMSSFGDVSFEEAIMFSTSFRYLYLAISHLLYLVSLLIVLRIGKRRVQIIGATEITAFIIVALALFTGSFSAILIDKLLVTNEKIVPYIIVIIVSMFASAGVFWYLLLKVSRDSHIKTELLLSKQREELYKDSVVSTNEQIEKISDIKHDLKNNIMSVSTLIADGEYEAAQKLCNSVEEQLTLSYTPVHTDNQILNAILNVEIKKSQSQNIDFSYDIGHTLQFVEDSDIVSIIGNLCDNAIEYLATLPVQKRKMSISVTVNQSYICVTCKNAITQSVLSENPDLNTTKQDKTLHGKGIVILRNLAEKYGGNLWLSESNHQLTVSVIMLERQ